MSSVMWIMKKGVVWFLSAWRFSCYVSVTDLWPNSIMVKEHTLHDFNCVKFAKVCFST
jgi:hypothetical protein